LWLESRKIGAFDSAFWLCCISTRKRWRGASQARGETQMSRNTSLSFLLLSGVSLLAACGGDDKNANTGQPAQVQCPPGQIYDGRLCQTVGPPGAAPTAGTPAATTPGTTTPAATATAPAGIPGVATTQTGPTATQLDPTAAQAATQLITPLGAQHAPGAKAVGSAIAGNFQQGQSLEAQVQMNPGKCYTVIGVGLPPVANLDISLVPALPIPGLPAATMAADNTVGSTAIVGDKPNCFRWALPMSGMMKVVMTVSQGSGVAAAQVFEK
jgi:hypothetical protein